MKNLIRVRVGAVLLLLTGIVVGQAVTSPTLVITQSGNAVSYPNVNKATQLTVVLTIAGNPTGPSSASVITSGCFASGSCDVLNTYSATSSTTINVGSLSKNYDYFSTQASFSGGNQPAVAVVYIISSPSTTPSSSALNLQLYTFNGTPIQSCSSSYLAEDTTTGNYYGCWNGNWIFLGGSIFSGSGTPYSIQTLNAAGSGAATVNVPLSPASFTQVLCNTPTSGGAAQQSLFCPPGIAGRSVSTTTDVIGNGSGTISAPGGSTDCGPNRIVYTGSSPVAVSLPDATTLGVPKCTFKVINQLTGVNAITITPNTWTINGGASLVVNPNQVAWVYTDPAGANNWSVDLACGPVGGTVKQISISQGVGACGTTIDYPDNRMYRGAICLGGTATANEVSSVTANFTPTCRAGTNNLGAYLSGSTGSSLQFSFNLPADWDTTNQPFVAVVFDSLALTSGTVIWTASVSCSSVGGTVTDDQAFAANAAFPTKTMASANKMWNTSGQFTVMTSGNGCVVGARVIVKLALSGTIGGPIGFDYASVTIPRLLTVQAN